MSEERDCPRQSTQIKKGGSVTTDADAPVKRPPAETKPSREKKDAS